MYTLPLFGPGVIRDSDGRRLVSGGEGWAEYQAWLNADANNAPAAPQSPSPTPKVVSYDEWLALFTAEERAWAFSSTDPLVVEAITRGASARSISLASPTVTGFLDLCIAKGSPLDATRKARILSGLPPLV